MYMYMYCDFFPVTYQVWRACASTMLRTSLVLLFDLLRVSLTMYSSVTHYVLICHSLCAHLSLTMYSSVTHYYMQVPKRSLEETRKLRGKKKRQQQTTNNSNKAEMIS